MNKKFLRILCLVLAAVLVIGLFAGALATVASAATVYQLTALLAEGKIKPLGRTQKNLAGDGITADWSGSGFDINVSGDGGTMTVGFSSNYTAYWAVLVDGSQIWRAQTAATTGSFSVEIPAGSHTVRVVKETQMSSSETGYSYLTTLAFGGTIEKAPANKGLYIEFVGDSITCGDGALGEYEPGVKWLGAHDSATHSYAYYAAQKLGADYSLVARGGIGLFVGISEAEGTAQKKGMQDIYNYTSAYNPTSNGEYSFSRQPDVVFIELGANDSIDSSDQYKTIAYWKSLMEDFIDQVRSKNPNAQIVLHSTNAAKYKALMEIKEARKESDPKIHTFYYAYLGNGSAALATQYAGHPDASDLERFGDALAKFLKAQDIVPTGKSNPTYNDITYYVSENGNDANDGKTIDTAKKTLKAAWQQAGIDNSAFADGSRLVFRLQGTVKYATDGSQGFMNGVKKTADGKKLPVLVTTYDYSGTKAVMNTGLAAVNDGHGAMVIYNDVTFKDITIQSTTNESTGWRHRNLYGGYNNVVFDNVTFDMNGATPTNGNTGWRIGCGTGFGSDTHPAELTYCSITFKNGDYTNLDYATAVMSSGMWTSAGTIYDAPGSNFNLIIEDGAKMSTVYNRYGTLNVGRSEVIINGGSVNQYIGTTNGNSTSDRRAYKGDVNLTVNGGTIYGTHFSTVSAYVKLEGNINTTINGGIFEITPKDTSGQYDSYLFSGRAGCALQDVNTTINGGQFYLIFDVVADSAFYFGPSGGSTCRNVTNKISAGLFMPYSRGTTGKDMCLYFGGHTGHITGTLRNEITGGNFQFGLAGASNRTVNAGSRGVNLAIGKIENVFGKSGSTHGPNMSSAVVNLAGGWAQVGVSTKLSAQPTECSDTVVVSNTIYGGNYSNIYLGSTGNPNLEKGYYSFIKGSIENKIYGGFFPGNVFCAGNGPVFGHVKTDVYGGFFKSIYGGTETTSTVFDGVELNIRGMDEYYPVNPNDSWVFCGGNKSGKVPVPMTEGRPAIKFTIAPTKSNELTLNTKLKVGETDGTASVAVSGGIYPRGFEISGKTVGAALASGYVAFDGSTGKKATYAGSDTKVEGYVMVDKNAETITNELVYYVSENGLDAYSGTSMATPKKTLRAAFSEVIADNGSSPKFPAGTSLTIYVEGRVNNDAGTGTQQLGGGQILYMSNVNDHVPVTITTYNYNGRNKATIVDNHAAVNGGNASAYVVNDLCFKDIDLQSVTNTATGYCDNNLYAAGCHITFDNCSITTDGKATKNDNAWNISADHFSTGGFNPIKYPAQSGCVTFKNGDYTNLGRVAAVGASSIWRSAENGGSVYSFPEMTCKIIIEDGAKMGNVYNAYGTLGVKTATVEIRGGTVNSLRGTRDAYLEESTKDGVTTYTDKTFTYNAGLVTQISGGTVKSFMGTGAGLYNDKNSADKHGVYITVNGDVNITVSGGEVEGTQFSGLNNYVKLNGNLTNTLSGGSLIIKPTDTTNNAGHGIFLSGRDYAFITGNVTNNISGGEMGVQIDLASTQSGIWMGLRSGGKITGNLTNNVSGGDIWVRTAEGITADYGDFHSGNFSGGIITGTLTNNITGGTFEIPRGSYFFGQQGVSGSIKEIINIFGDKETGNGPVFKGTQSICMAGNFGRVGVTNNSGTMPAASASTDTVVISNKIYGGTFNTVYASVSSGSTTNVGYVKGSVQTDVYGGTFTSFYGTGNAPIFGHAKTNIHGGTFDAIYGTRNGTVYDGVELNIYGLTEGSNPTGIFNAGTAKISTQTAGRDAVKLTIDPKTALTLSMPITVNKGTVTGTTSALVTGGTYTKGFAVAGLKVKEVLATGLVPLKDADKTIVKVTADMTTTGTDSVTLVTTKWSADTVKVTLSDTTVTWDGVTNAKIPTDIVTFHSSQLVKDTDYTVSYSRDGAATTDLNSLGTVTVTATAKAPFSGTATATYTIVRDDAVGAAIAEAAAAVTGYDEATVKSSDGTDLTALKGKINQILTDNAEVLTADEKLQLQDLQKAVGDLEDKLAEVAEQLADAKTEAGKYTDAAVTADDTAALTALAADIAAIPDGNLTAAEKTDKKALADKVTQLQAKIGEVASKLANAKTQTDKYSEATVTADDSDKLAKLAGDIAAIPDGNLTAAQKTEKKAVADKVAKLQKVITDTAAELARVQAAAESYKEDTVSSSDKTALQTLASDIAAISDGNLTTEQKAAKKAAAAKVTAMLAIIADAADELAAVAEEVAKYDLYTITVDDEVALQTLKTRLNAIPDAKLTEAEQGKKQTLAGKLNDMLTTIEDVVVELETAQARYAALRAAELTAEDVVELDTLAEDLVSIRDNNLTAAQKAAKKDMLSGIEAMKAQLAEVAEKLTALKNKANGYNEAAVTGDDSADLAKLATDIAAIPDANLTALQKADKKAAAEKVAKLQKVITDVQTKLDKAAADLAAYNESNVSLDDYDALNAIAQQLAAIPEGNLTNAQKQTIAQQQATINTLLLKADEAEQKLAELVNAAFAIEEATVTSDDADEIAKLKADLNALPAGNLSARANEIRQSALAHIAALEAKLDEVARKQAAVETALADYKETTVTADDEEALKKLASDLAAISNNNLTAAEIADKQAAAEKIEALRTRIADTAAKLADAKAAADAIDGDKVTSADGDKLTDLETKLAAIPEGNLTSAQKAERKAIADKLAAARKTISDTAADLKALEEKEAAFESDKLTSADKEKLQALITEIESYPVDHITEAEQADLKALVDSAKAKIATIEKSEQLAGDIGAIEAALAGKTTANVTSADSPSLQAAKKAIDELGQDASLSAADKAKLADLETKIAQLEDQLEKADKADEIPEAVQAVKPETVEKTDKAALEAAIDQLDKAAADYAANYTEAEKKAIADQKAALEAALTIIEEVEAVQEQIAKLPATAEPDDEKAIADLADARAAYGELNDRQKGMVTAAELEKLDKLAASLKDYKITKGNKSEWTQKSGKDLSFTANGLFSKFQGVQVDGSTVDSKYYTAKSGSTVITLTDEFLDSLAKGEHSIKVVFTDGETVGTFTVKAKAASPSTGDETNLALLSLLAVFSVAAAAAVAIGMRKREQ